MNTPEQIFQHGISPSMVKLWTICKHRWYNHYVRGWRREDQRYAKFGIGIHEFLDDWYSPEKAKMTVDQHRAKFAQCFTEDMNFEKRNQDQGFKIIEKYGQIYNRESEPFRVVEREQAYQVEVPGLPTKLNMKIDGLIEYRSGLWLFEHKTTSFIGPSYFRQFKMDFQPIAYIKGVSTAKNAKIEGIFYNAIAVHKQINEKSFGRDDMSACKTQAQIEYLWEEFCKVAIQMYTKVNNEWDSPNNFELNATSNACFSFNTQCPFMDVCECNDNERLWSGEVHQIQGEKK